MQTKIKKRLQELTLDRKRRKIILRDFEYLQGKFLKQNKKAAAAISAALTNTGIICQELTTYRKGKQLFDFSGLKDSIARLEEQIGAVDTIETIPEEMIIHYIEAVKNIRQQKNAIRTILQCNVQGIMEFNNIFGVSVL